MKLILIILFYLLYLPCFPQLVIKHVNFQDYKISFDVPFEWDTIPTESFSKTMNATNIILGNKKNDFQGGLYYSENNNNFDYPYILYQFEKVTITDFEQTDLSELAKIYIENMKSSGDVFLKNGLYGKLLDTPIINNIDIDYKKSGFYFTFTTDVVNYGPIIGRCAVFFGREGVYKLFGYTKMPEYEKFRFTFKAFFNSFEQDKGNTVRFKSKGDLSAYVKTTKYLLQDIGFISIPDFVEVINGEDLDSYSAMSDSMKLNYKNFGKGYQLQIFTLINEWKYYNNTSEFTIRTSLKHAGDYPKLNFITPNREELESMDNTFKKNLSQVVSQSQASIVKWSDVSIQVINGMKCLKLQYWIKSKAGITIKKEQYYFYNYDRLHEVSFVYTDENENMCLPLFNKMLKSFHITNIQ